MKEQLKQAIKKIKEFQKYNIITPREFKILEYRLGLDDGKEHTLEETGEIFGITRERVRQIQEKAFERIKGIDKGLDK